MVERLARRHLDDPAQHVGGDRVVPLGAGLEQQRQAGPGVAAGGQVRSRRRAPLEAGGPVHGVDRVGVVEAVGQAGGVGQQVPDPHRLDGRDGDRFEGRAAVVDPDVGERRDEAADRILQLEGALLVQHHGRDRCDRLGHRVDPPQRVGLDRQARLDVALAVAGQVHDLAGPADHHQPPGQPAVVDVRARSAGRSAPAARRRTPPRPGRPRSSGLPPLASRFG